jgi:hypothetical protein
MSLFSCGECNGISIEKDKIIYEGLKDDIAWN